MYKITCANSRSTSSSVSGAKVAPETPETLELLQAWKDAQRGYYFAEAEQKIREICSRNGWQTPAEKMASAVARFCSKS